jgi:multidrug resistance efflux pump
MANSPSPQVIRWGPSLLLVVTLGVGLSAAWLGPAHGVLGYAEVAQVSVGAPVAGLVKTVLVREGDQVVAGDVVARMDGALHAARLEVLQATATMLQARAEAEEQGALVTASDVETRWTEARGELSAARGEVAALSSSLAQREAWVREGLGGAEELGRDQVALAAARARLSGLEEVVAQLGRALELSRAGAAPDAAVQRAALQELVVVQQEIAFVEAEREALTLRATSDGYVAALYVREGATVPAGAPLFMLVPHHAQRVVACATEEEAAAIVPGERALLWPVDGRPAVDATVLSVGALVAEPDLRCRTMVKRAEFIRPVYLRLDADARLLSGSRVTARFLGGAPADDRVGSLER